MRPTEPLGAGHEPSLARSLRATVILLLKTDLSEKKCSEWFLGDLFNNLYW